MTLALHSISASPSADRPLNICIVSGESRRAVGGLSAYARMLVKQLKSAGVTVSTVSRFDRPEAGPLDYAAPSIGDGSPIDGIPTALIQAPSLMRPLLRQLPHLTGRPNLRRWPPKIYARAFALPLRRAIPSDCDVIHFIGTGWELLGFAALAEARRRGIGFCIWPAVHAGTWGDSPLDVDLYDQADAVFCQSDHEIEHLANLGVSRRRFVRAALAPVARPDGDAARFRTKHHLTDRPTILFIGRKVRTKGFHTLCEAMQHVIQRVPNACLVTIGPEGEKPYPKMDPGALINLGIADESTKTDALAACDIFCMPSSAESFGIVYVEAWSYGKPVVGGPAPAVRELISEGQTGFTVEQDPRALADILTNLLQNEPLRQRIGQAGRALQQERYTWPTVASLHLDVFHSVCASRFMCPTPYFAQAH